MQHQITIAPTPKAWAETAATAIIVQAHAALQERGEFTLVLSGGSTPRPVYRLLAARKDQIDWEHTYIFWGDERCVPPDHPESNYGMVKEALLDAVPIPGQNVFRMLGEVDPQTAARDYEELLAAFFVDRPRHFDIVLLGLGEDGHTASLFPGTLALFETVKWVVPNQYPYSDSMRLTMTYPALDSARQILFLVTGENKAEVAAEVIRHPEGPPPYPAKQVGDPAIRPHWILDLAAAGKL